MVFWLFILCYGGIAAFALRQSYLEYQASTSREMVSLVLGALACLLWPLAVLALLVAFQSKMISRDQSPHYS